MSHQVCRVCGCTEGGACFDAIEQQPCSWAAENLCTVCARVELAINRLRRSEVGAASLLAVSNLLDVCRQDGRDLTCVLVLFNAGLGENSDTYRTLLRSAACAVRSPESDAGLRGQGSGNSTPDAELGHPRLAGPPHF